jgi:phosphatidylserine/phosphatidylglycerophosphate/cardiolipin synthase-like enzyme
MRFRSEDSGGFQVFAVTGINTVSFGIKASAEAQKGLLGFGVERADPKEGEKYVMPGFKVFRSVIPHPDANTRVTTMEHPVQSFVWDDFTAKPDRDYEYTFHPIKGKPKNLDRSTPPVTIKIHTEPLFSNEESDVFFNRGVASSQAYAREFKNKKPDELPAPDAERARKWLRRDLLTAILRFIDKTPKGDALRCCFYEFRYAPVLDALKNAIDRGVDVKIIFDAKANGTTAKDGTVKASFPREDNLKFIKDAEIAGENLIQREARTSNIAHNKFMVRLKGKNKVPIEVWSGSTNISEGGIHGQTNVGHWLRNGDVAKLFLDYWTLLSDDPGGKTGEAAPVVKTKNKTFQSAVDALNKIPDSLEAVAKGVTPVFSPRTALDILSLYFELVGAAAANGCITLAFGVNKDLKDRLTTNTSKSAIVFLLLEKEDKPNPKSKDPFVPLNARNNVYAAWGSFLKDPLYQWTRETNTSKLQINTHVSYIHSKFLLRDPLGKDPIVVTGSANFSSASTTGNDENMLIIRGDHRVADIYFTEFNRLFNHYYFRAVHEATTKDGKDDGGASLFLKETAGEWLPKYRPGLLRRKRLDLYTRMEGFTE